MNSNITLTFKPTPEEQDLINKFNPTKKCKIQCTRTFNCPNCNKLVRFFYWAPTKPDKYGIKGLGTFSDGAEVNWEAPSHCGATECALIVMQ